MEKNYENQKIIDGLEYCNWNREILEDIKITCLKNKRDPKSVNVIAICKRQPLQKITQAIDAGINNFGENRVQDGINRWSKIKSKRLFGKNHISASHFYD